MKSDGTGSKINNEINKKLREWNEMIINESTNLVKTTIVLEILSEGHINENLTLEDIARESLEGGFSAWWTVKEEKELSKEEAIEECVKHGTEPEFFGIESDD